MAWRYTLHKWTKLLVLPQWCSLLPEVCLLYLPKWLPSRDRQWVVPLEYTYTPTNDILVNLAVNQDFRKWCSSIREYANKNAFLPLPSTCAPSGPDTNVRRSWSDDETDNQYSSRSGDGGLNISVGALVGIIVAALVVFLTVALCISGSKRGRRNRRATTTYRLYPASRLNAVQTRNTFPRRPPAAVVRASSPRPPPPYTAKEEAAPQYEMTTGGPNNNAVTIQPNT